MTDPDALVRRYYELVDAGDVDGICRLFAPDGTYQRPGYDLLRGHEDLRRFFGGERVIASGRHVLRRVAVHGLQVAVEGDFAGVLRDGSAATASFADFWDLDAEGRVLQRRTYFDAALV